MNIYINDDMLRRNLETSMAGSNNLSTPTPWHKMDNDQGWPIRQIETGQKKSLVLMTPWNTNRLEDYLWH